MELTLTYDYYSNTFKGQLSENEFDVVLPKAIDFVQSLINAGEPTEMTDNLKKALCYSVDYNSGIGSGAGDISSETLGDYSYTKDHGAMAVNLNRQVSSVVRFLQYEGLYDPAIKLVCRKCCLC